MLGTYLKLSANLSIYGSLKLCSLLVILEDFLLFLAKFKFKRYNLQSFETLIIQCAN